MAPLGIAWLVIQIAVAVGIRGTGSCIAVAAARLLSIWKLELRLYWGWWLLLHLLGDLRGNRCWHGHALGFVEEDDFVAAEGLEGKFVNPVTGYCGVWRLPNALAVTAFLKFRFIALVVWICTFAA